MSQPAYLRDYLATIRPGRILQMRDPNDNSRSRYQYTLLDGQPARRRLPQRGFWRDDPAAAGWEPLNDQLVTAIRIARLLGRKRVGHPIVDFFLSLT